MEGGLITLEELIENIKNLKNTGEYWCNLIPAQFWRSVGKRTREYEIEVKKNKDIWEVYSIGERGGCDLESFFYSEYDCYEYVYCRFIIIADDCSWFRHLRMGGGLERFTREMRLYKIPNSAYSLDGGMAEDCLCIEKKEDTWEVYYSNSGEKTVLGVLYKEYLAYDYLLYLLMKKHVDSKKLWWKRYNRRQ